MTNLNRSGVILIFSFVILGFLAIFSLFFVYMSIQGKYATINWRYKIEADFAAESSLAVALEKLKLAILENPYQIAPSKVFFPGEDRNKNGFLDPGEDINNNGILDIKEADLGLVTSTSFPIATTYINGKKHYVSLYMPAGIANATLVGKLKIIDGASLIDVNGSNPKQYLLLNNLFESLGIKYKLTKNPIDITGEHFLSVSSFLKKFQLTEYNFLSNFITVHSYENDKVIVPPFSEDTEWKRRENELVISELQTFHEVEKLTKRQPININTAPYYVLVSLFSNLKSLYLNQYNFNYKMPTETRDIMNFSLPQDITQIGQLNVVSLSREKAENLARAIIRRRSERKEGFRNWTDFYEFLKSNASGLSTIEADLVMANCNPNSDLKRFNPDSPVFKQIDKSDLIDYTTEITFYPTGIFYIEVLGMLITNKEVIASSKIKTTVKLFDLIYDTTQRDFNQGGGSKQRQPGIFTYRNRAIEIYPEFNVGDSLTRYEFDGMISRAPIQFFPGYLDYVEQQLRSIKELDDKQISYFLHPDGLFMPQTSAFTLPISVLLPAPQLEVRKAKRCSIAEPLCGKFNYSFSGTIAMWLKPFLNNGLPRMPFKLLTPVNIDQSSQIDLTKVFPKQYQIMSLINSYEQGNVLVLGEIPLYVERFIFPQQRGDTSANTSAKRPSNVAFQPAKLLPHLWNFIELDWEINYSDFTDSSANLTLHWYNAEQGISIDFNAPFPPTLLELNDNSIFTIGGNYKDVRWNIPLGGTLGGFYVGAKRTLQSYPPSRYYSDKASFLSKKYTLDHQRHSYEMLAIITCYNQPVGFDLVFKLQTDFSKITKKRKIDPYTYQFKRTYFDDFFYLLSFPKYETPLLKSEIVDDVTLIVFIKPEYLEHVKE